MGFTVHNPSRILWLPADYNGAGGAARTHYVGSIVGVGKQMTAQGALTIGAGAGASDTTGKAVPFGVVVGTSNRTPLYDSTYKTEYIASVATQANQVARDFILGEGMYARDPQALIQVALIGPDTILEGPIFNAAYGTAPSVETVSAVGSDGLSMTSSTLDFTPVAYNATSYCRKGTNMGLYRVMYGTSATALTYYTAWPYALATTDTFVHVNLSVGTCRAQFDSLGLWIENSAALTSDYYILDVLELDLSEAGKEKAVFKFNADQFCAARA